MNRITKWHELREEVLQHITDALVSDYVSRVEESRAFGSKDFALRWLDCELEIAGGIVVVHWAVNEWPCVSVCGRENYLPLLSEWFANALSQYGLDNIENTALYIIEEADRECRDIRETENSLRRLL